MKSIFLFLVNILFAIAVNSQGGLEGSGGDLMITTLLCIGGSMIYLCGQNYCTTKRVKDCSDLGKILLGARTKELFFLC